MTISIYDNTTSERRVAVRMVIEQLLAIALFVAATLGCTGVHVPPPAGDAGAALADAAVELDAGPACWPVDEARCAWFGEMGARYAHLGTPSCEANCPRAFTEACVRDIIGANNCERFDEAAASCDCRAP